MESNGELESSGNATTQLAYTDLLVKPMSRLLKRVLPG
jgi:hypothetical protein